MKKLNSIRLFLCLTFFYCVSGQLSADWSATDPEAWFRDGYAPLWNERPGEQLDAMLTYYAAEIVSHRATGEITTDDSAEWLGPSVETWLAEGWLRSELAGLDVDRVNESTVVFKARWADFYANQPTDYSCGWYLADYRESGWSFTSYADLDCSALDD